MMADYPEWDSPVDSPVDAPVEPDPSLPVAPGVPDATPPGALGAPQAPPTLDIGGRSHGWRDVLAILGSVAESVGGGKASPLSTLALKRMGDRRETDELQKVGQIIALSQGDPKTLASMQAQVQGPQAQKLVAVAIQKAAVLAEKRATAAQQKKEIDDPMRALLNEQMPNPAPPSVPMLNATNTDANPAMIPRQLYRGDRRIPPGAQKAGWDITGLRPDPKAAADAEDLKLRTTSETRLAHDEAGIPIAADKALAIQTKLAQGVLAEDLGKYTQKEPLQFADFMKRKLAEGVLSQKQLLEIASDPQLLAAEIARDRAKISGTATAKEQAAVGMETVLAEPRATTEAGITTAKVNAQRAIVSGDRKVATGEQYYRLDPKTRKLTKAQDMSTGEAMNPETFRHGTTFAANPQVSRQVDFLVAARETVPELRKLGQRLLASGANPGDNLQRALEIYAKNVGKTDPLVVQFYNLRNALLSEMVVAEASTGRPSNMIRQSVEKHQLPSILMTVESLGAGMDTIDWVLENRIGHSLGFDASPLKTTAPPPGRATIGGGTIQRKNWRDTP